MDRPPTKQVQSHNLTLHNHETWLKTRKVVITQLRDSGSIWSVRDSPVRVANNAAATPDGNVGPDSTWEAKFSNVESKTEKPEQHSGLKAEKKCL